MPRIFVHAETPGVSVRAEVVTISDIDGIYGIHCTGDGTDECPGDIEPGDTWSNFEDCVREAERHIANHEARVIAPVNPRPYTFSHTRHWCGYDQCRDS